MLARTPELRGGPAERVRRLKSVRAVVRSWRSLTGARRTLVACSGGADSVALLLALRSATDDLVVGHVLHDMRPAQECEADRAYVESLARDLGLPMSSRAIEHDKGGNVESALRTLRYRALAELAQEADAPFVASAHHADDQLESMLLALTRGAGPGGLAGVAPARPISGSVTLVRPMLSLHRSETEAICEEADVDWRHDQTNDDRERARTVLRQDVAPGLRDLRPAAARNASRSADLLRDASGLVADRAAEVFGEGCEWPRCALAGERAIVIGEGLRRAALRLTGSRGADRLPRRVTDQAVRAIRDHRTDVREFELPLGVVLRVEAHVVRMLAGQGDYPSSP